ncbi:MAG: hypothetical protein AB7S44_00890 [Spirochaetales bacterium]
MEEKEQVELINKDTDVIILLVDNKTFHTRENSYDIKLFGNSMLGWIKFAVEGSKVKEVKANLTDDVVSVIKPHLGDKKYTAVFYSDTPLLERKTFLEIIEYVTVKGLSALKLTRGYVFETEYLKTIDKIYNPQVAYFEEEDFIAAYNLKQLGLVSDILKNRILSYHLKRGIRIIDTANTYIDSQVNIEEGVTIYPNNFIYGNSYIESGVTLKENNVIKDSYILEGATVSASHIYNSIVGKKCEVGPFVVMKEESILEDNCKVGSFVDFKKGKLTKNSTVKHLSFIGREDL